MWFLIIFLGGMTLRWGGGGGDFRPGFPPMHKYCFVADSDTKNYVHMNQGHLKTLVRVKTTSSKNRTKTRPLKSQIQTKTPTEELS